jgi:hypothetical protein
MCSHQLLLLSVYIADDENARAELFYFFARPKEPDGALSTALLQGWCGSAT